MDSAYLFDMFLENVKKYKDGQSASMPERQTLPNPLLVDLLSKERVGVDMPDGIKSMLAQQNAGKQSELQYAAGAA